LPLSKMPTWQYCLTKAMDSQRKFGLDRNRNPNYSWDTIDFSHKKIKYWKFIYFYWLCSDHFFGLSTKFGHSGPLYTLASQTLSRVERNGLKIVHKILFLFFNEKNRWPLDYSLGFCFCVTQTSFKSSSHWSKSTTIKAFWREMIYRLWPFVWRMRDQILGFLQSRW